MCLQSRCLDRLKSPKCTSLPGSKAASATDSYSRGLFTCSQGSYDSDKPMVLLLVDRGAGKRYVIPARSAEESTVRLLLTDHEKGVPDCLYRRISGVRPTRGATHSPANTSSTATANMLMARHTSTAARATCRWLLPHRRVLQKQAKGVFQSLSALLRAL